MVLRPLNPNKNNINNKPEFYNLCIVCKVLQFQIMQLLETYFQFAFVKQKLKLFSFGIFFEHYKTIIFSKHKALMLFMV